VEVPPDAYVTCSPGFRGFALAVATESLRMVFHDIGAVIYFLRKVIWIVPGFTVDRYRIELRTLHDRIQADGPFVAHATRFLIEARKPA
jgi:hypothetical protein